MGPALFAFEDVVLVRSGRRVLDGVTATVADEGITCLVGASGSGKSSLLRLCNRLEVPSSGRVRFRGDDVADLDPLAHRRRVGMVFQAPTPFPGSVAHNLAVADPDADEARCVEVLGRAGLGAGFLDRGADELSGGEAQRMCLARALMAGPEVLCMDEPTSALDDDATAALEGLALDLAHGQGVPVLWVSHDRAQVARIADHRLVIEQGRLVRGDGDG